MKGTKWMAMAALGVLMAPWMMVKAQDQPAPATAATVIPEDQRATDEQLNRLFEVMRVKQQMAAATQAMPQIVKQQFQQQMQELEKDHPELASLNDEQREAMGKVMQKFMGQAMTLYGTDEMMADMRALYQKHLSRSDVEATIAFYSTPAGQHVLDMVPAMMQEFLPNVMAKMQTRMRPLILEMTKELTELAQPPAK